MSQSVQIAGPPLVRRLTRGFMWLFFITAVIAGALFVLFGTIRLVQSLSSGHVTLTLVAGHRMPSSAAQGSVTILEGGYDTATLTLSGVSGPTLVLWVIALVAGILTQLAFCGSGAILAWRLLHPLMFKHSFSVSVTIAGGIVAIAGLLTQGASSLASGSAAALLNGSDPSGFWPIAGEIDLTYVGMGLVLMLVGLAFDYGSRLQNETDGLI